MPDLGEDSFQERGGEDEWILVDIVNGKTKPQSGMTPKTRHKICTCNT